MKIASTPSFYFICKNTKAFTRNDYRAKYMSHNAVDNNVTLYHPTSQVWLREKIYPLEVIGSLERKKLLMVSTVLIHLMEK